MCKQDPVCAVIRGIALSLAVCMSSGGASRGHAQAAQIDAATASVLAQDATQLVAEFAERRDAIGGWPANVQTNYTLLTQLSSQLGAAVTAGNLTAVERRYRAFQRVAARISRWLINRYEPRNESAPSAENRDAVIARLTERLSRVSGVAAQAGAALDLTAANAARQQVETARANGTDAQLRAALRALRDQIDALQDAIPDPTN